VKLDNGVYGIIAAVDNDGPYPLSFWKPDLPKAAAAIEKSVEMPEVRHGIGSDVIHVFGRDETGAYLVKLFYNFKKLELGRVDELYRD